MNKHSSAARATIFFISILALPAINGPSRKSWAQEKSDGIKWTYNLAEARAKANKERKPLMIHFTAVWCGPCQEMKKKAFSDARIIKRSGAFIPVRIDIDEQHEVAAKYNALARKYGGIGVPNILFLASNGAKLKHIVGYQSPEQLLAAMDAVLAIER
jgi:thioredoxin:protein disulfide reductase